MINVMNLFSLEDKVIAVTGAAGYMGGTFVESIAQAKGNLILLDHQGTDERLKEVADTMMAQYGVTAKYYTVDINNEDEVEKAAAAAIADFGRVDGLVNGAGVNHHSTIENYKLEDVQRVFNINVGGTFAVTKHFGKYMCEQKHGSIVNICSMAGTIVNDPPQVMAAYCTSKGGVKHLTHAIAAEWGEHNVRCNAISPGVMDQGMSNIKGKQAHPELGDHMKAKTPMHRTCAAWELCGALIYLLSDASSFTTGAEIMIDGGITLW
jgi:gluconate 5-dehydrogenase